MGPAPSQDDLGRLRQRVLEALDLLWFPAHLVEELIPLLETAHHEPVDLAALRQLMDQERTDVAAGRSGAVWLCLGITPDLSGDPDRWARSDRPLEVLTRLLRSPYGCPDGPRQEPLRVARVASPPHRRRRRRHRRLAV
jgi:hypothetical protein